MVKEFRVVLDPPPQNGYVANSEVTGHVFLVTDEAKSGYKAIEVTLKGYATVCWKETSGTGENRQTNTYHSHEDYIANTAVLWSKDSAPGGQIAAGSYQFQFSLRFLAGHDQTPLPPSFHGTVGKIVYEVEAVIVKSALKFNKKFSVEVPYVPVVDLNFTAEVFEPKILQVQKTVCCLCCASGPISLTARIPRSGFCIGIDAIPFEVDVENGSNRHIRWLQALLIRRVIYFAQGNRHFEVRNIGHLNNNTPIQPGNSTSWKPPPLPIPNTGPVFTTCKIIQLKYFLRVQARLDYAVNPHVEFDLLLGNVPMRGIEGSQPFPSPSAPPATAPYPAHVPSQGTPYSADPTPPYPLDPTPYPPAPYLQPIPQPAAFAPPPPTGLPPGFVDPIKR